MIVTNKLKRGVLMTSQDKIAQIIDSIDIEKEAFIQGFAAGVLRQAPKVIKGLKTTAQNAGPFIAKQKASAQQWGKAIANDWKSTSGAPIGNRISSAYRAGMVENPTLTTGLIHGGSLVGGATLGVGAANRYIDRRVDNKLSQLQPGGTVIKSAAINADIEKFAKELVEKEKADPMDILAKATIGGVGLGVGIATGGKIKQINARNQKIMEETAPLRDFYQFVANKTKEVNQAKQEAFDKLFEGVEDKHLRKVLKQTHTDGLKTLEAPKRDMSKAEAEAFKADLYKKLDAMAENSKTPQAIIDDLKLKIDSWYKG